jgi:hypothetical protein
MGSLCLQRSYDLDCGAKQVESGRDGHAQESVHAGNSRNPERAFSEARCLTTSHDVRGASCVRREADPDIIALDQALARLAEEDEVLSLPDDFDLRILAGGAE